MVSRSGKFRLRRADSRLSMKMISKNLPDINGLRRKMEEIFMPIEWTGQKTADKAMQVEMHRQILNTPEGVLVDHINHNGLDNRRANLRLVTIEQNSWNKRKQRGNCTSKYKGVSWHKMSRRWHARIVYKQKWISIGYFDDEQSAAKAYDNKAKQLFKNYAVLNFPNDLNPNFI